MSKSEKSYKTDKHGRAADRDYHYRIPKQNDRAMRNAALALHGMFPYSNRLVDTWKEFSGNSLEFFGIRTIDSKGHLQRLERFSHSPKWNDAKGCLLISEYRQNPHGGTKITGRFSVDPVSFSGISRLQYTTTVDPTPTELEAAIKNRGETWIKIQKTIEHAKTEAIEEAHEQIAQYQEECDHENTTTPTECDKDHGPEKICMDCKASLTVDNQMI